MKFIKIIFAIPIALVMLLIMLPPVVVALCVNEWNIEKSWKEMKDVYKEAKHQWKTR